MGRENLKKYYAKFSCGHRGYISYYGTSDLMKKLAKIEKDGLCPDCKAKELKENATLLLLPYHVYKEKFAHKRNVMTGRYLKDSKKIEVYLPDKLAKEFLAEEEKVFYDAEYIGEDENGYKIISLFIKGNSYRIRDELKKLGFIWKNKFWRKEMIVFLSYYENTQSQWMPPEDNPEFYSVIKKLEKIGCIANFTKLNFDNI